MRLRPLDLSADELRERRLLCTGVVAVLSNGVAVEVRDVQMLGDELVGYMGVVLPCVLGVDELPVGELVPFEPAHVEATYAPWRWLELAENARRRRRRSPGVPHVAPSCAFATPVEYRRAFDTIGRLGKVRDPLD